MENKNKVEELIGEFRLRIEQLKSYSDEDKDYLVGVAQIADWLWKVKEFQPAFEYLEGQRIEEALILDEARDKLFKGIKKTWGVLKKIITVLSFKNGRPDLKELIFIKGEKGRKFELQLKRMLEGEEKFDISDIYHALRYSIEQAYHSTQKEKILKNNLVIFNNIGEIKEFVPNYVYQALLSFSEVENQLKEQLSYSPLEAFSYLKQLLVLRDQDNWRWQLKEWRSVFGKEFYTPRLYLFSNFLFDFLVLGIKKEIDFPKQEKFAIKDLKLKFEKVKDDENKYKLVVGERGKQGYIVFDRNKSCAFCGQFIVGEIVKLLVENPKNQISFKEIMEKIKELTLNDIRGYIVYLNGRFEKAFQDGDLKLSLVVWRKNINSQNYLKLLAFPFRLSQPTPKTANHIR